MANMTNFLENKLIDFLFRGQALGIAGASAAAGSGPTNLRVALFTAITDGEVPTVTEVSGGSYARVTVASSLANWAGTQGAGTTVASTGTGGVTSNNAAITFPAPTANWGTIVGFGIYDSATGGNLLMYGTLASSKTVNSGDPAPAFNAAQLTVTFA